MKEFLKKIDFHNSIKKITSIVFKGTSTQMYVYKAYNNNVNVNVKVVFIHDKKRMF